MSLLFYNGVVHSLDEQDSIYEAIAISGSKIERVGDTSVLAREFPEAEQIDLQGGHVYPGFVDAHAHPYGMGERLTKPRLEGTRSKEEVLGRVSGMGYRVSEGGDSDSRWLVSRGWDQSHWADTSFPTRDDLDRDVSDKQPIALTRIDGHALWCNTRALEIAGIDRDMPDPLGGAILHDDTGEPTGILLDEAMKFVESKIPLPTQEDFIATLRAGLHYFIERGHTAVHEMGVPAELWEAYATLYVREDESLPRAYVFLDMTKETGKKLFLESYSSTSVRRRKLGGAAGNRLTFAGIKLYLDGALGSRGANLFADYSDDPGNRGLALMDDDEAFELMRIAARHDLQIAVHAIGDKANARALDLFERLVKDPDVRNPILRIEHAQIARDEDVKRFAKLGAFALVQPAFFSSDRRWATERLGTERMRSAYRWASFIDAGVKFVASSDAPIEEPDPLFGIALFRSRDGIYDGEAITYDQAVRAYAQTAYELTRNAATRGKLATGFTADLTILNESGSTVQSVVIDGKQMLLS